MRRDSTPIYDLHGLRVRSSIALSAPSVRSAHVDLDVAWSRRHVRHDRRLPPGRLVARLAFGNGDGYRLVRTHSGWSMRFNRVGEFRLDPGLRRVRVQLVR